MSQTLKEWLPVFMPIISLLLGLLLTLIFTSIKQSKKNKFIRSKLEFLEKENTDNKLDFKLYKEKQEAWAFDMKVDLKKATDENALLIKKIGMYESGSNVEYNKELEAKLKEYMMSSDTLSNELLRYKNIVAESDNTIKKLMFENEQLKTKINLLEKQLSEQVNWIDQIKKFENALSNLKFPQKPTSITENVVLEASSTQDKEYTTQSENSFLSEDLTPKQADINTLEISSQSQTVKATLY